MGTKAKNFYYINLRTGETAWKAPPGVDVLEVGAGGNLELVARGQDGNS